MHCRPHTAILNEIHAKLNIMEATCGAKTTTGGEVKVNF